MNEQADYVRSKLPQRTTVHATPDLSADYLKRFEGEYEYKEQI